MAADNSGMIKIALFGGAAFLAYRQGWLGFLGIGGAPAAVAPAPAPVDPNKIQGANSLDAIYARMVSTAKAPAAGLAVDEWGFFLNNELAGIGKTAPDPMSIFPAAVPNFDRSQKLTAGQYWGVMAPALKSGLGLAGLGHWGGLGQLARGYR